jgi:hypothetical protein
LGNALILTVLISSSASNRIIHAKDHASIQINVADVDEKTGMALPTFKTYAICGSIRRMVIVIAELPNPCNEYNFSVVIGRIR